MIAEQAEATGKIYKIAVEKIVPNPSQPRRAFSDESIIRLADSIRQYGILQPLTVRRPDPGYDPDHAAEEGHIGEVYELIAGERRLRAAKLIGLAEVPCIIIEVDSCRSAELAIIENIQRENLNMFEQAGAIAALIDIYNLTQEEIAKKLSASQSYIANKLRILRFSGEERYLILSNNLTERHARALLRLRDPEQRKQAILVIAQKGLNVSATEEYIERLLEPKRKEESVKRTMIIKDIRIFYNSIDHAVEIVRRSGINVMTERRENEETLELIIKIPRRADRLH
ncbi:MAG: ParB/RepB/Spo0J family partition protein [Clostridiales bacterium]|nr:ParB/RepB/Spo0J family partition protein [Clostridiales bacterium]